MPKHRKCCISMESLERNLEYGIEQIKVDYSGAVVLFLDFSEYNIAMNKGLNVEFVKQFAEKIQTKWNVNSSRRSLIQITVTASPGSSNVRFYIEKIKKFI